MSVKYDPELLRFILARDLDLQTMLTNPEQIEKMMTEFREWIEKNPLNGILAISHKVEKDEEHNSNTLLVQTTRYGHNAETRLNYDSALSSEWVELNNLWKKFQTTAPLPMTVKFDKEPEVFTSYAEFCTAILEHGKKGNYIQRYKGLGEMNPEQLWETTLNPENRTLLQVAINDAIAADETFSVLMGEQVEPRRKFIHDNALLARELDV